MCMCAWGLPRQGPQSRPGGFPGAAAVPTATAAAVMGQALSSWAEPVRDICCEFCGNFFKNHKGSSNAHSHLSQIGVTEWSVSGSPIYTLREILKKSKLCLIKKEASAGNLAAALTEDGSSTAAAGAMHSSLPLLPLVSCQENQELGQPRFPGGSTCCPSQGLSPRLPATWAQWQPRGPSRRTASSQQRSRLRPTSRLNCPLRQRPFMRRPPTSPLRPAVSCVVFTLKTAKP